VAGAARWIQAWERVDTALWATLIIMPMQAESLEVLEKADLPPAQARAIVRAIEIELSGAKDTLATKHDLVVLGHEMRQEIVLVRQQVHQEIAAVRQEMSDLRAELRAEMSELRGELRGEIHSSASSVARQMYAALLGQMAVLLCFAYFFATHID
jgi:hypothetical protein